MINKSFICNNFQTGHNLLKNSLNVGDKSTFKQIFDGIDHSNLAFIIGFPRSDTTFLYYFLVFTQLNDGFRKTIFKNIEGDAYKNHQLSDIPALVRCKKLKCKMVWCEFI